MALQPRIVEMKGRKLIGRRLTMSLADNKTLELWRSFMPGRNSIQNRVGTHLISMRVYPETMQPENSSQQFDKWAALEVSSFDDVPAGMESFFLEGGLYAIFDYKGLNTDDRIFIYIFKEWLPGSGYELDERPQFEILGDRYRNNDPESEEEIAIPIKAKQ